MSASKLKNMTLRYIPSAFESGGGFLTTNKYYPNMANDMLISLSNQEEDIDVGVLYNAFSESHSAPKYNKICRPLGIKQYADSGGLQVISIGAEITKEIKSEIFHTQMDNSDYALSFDEIPVSFGANDSKFYVDEWFKTKAIESGQNIVEQIRVFKKDPTTKAKILFIVQSRNFETAREWSWFMFQEIKKEPDYEKYIGGLALGNTLSGGLRNVFDFMLRFQNELDFLPESWRKKIHILGAGSVSRLLPALCVHDNYSLPGTIITSDSTTQTRSSIFGNYYEFNEKTQCLDNMQPGRGINAESLKMIDSQWKYAEPYFKKYKKEYNLIPTNAEEFRNNYTEYADNGLRLKADFVDLYGKCDEGDYQYQKRGRIARFFWTMSMLNAFLKFIESIKTRSDEFRAGSQDERVKISKSVKKSLPHNLYKPAEHLMNISSWAQYIGNSALSGHPYSIELPLSETKNLKNGILEYKGTKYQTDLYNGKLLGRELMSITAGKDGITPTDTRTKILVLLGGMKIDVQRTETSQYGELDEW